MHSDVPCCSCHPYLRLPSYVRMRSSLQVDDSGKVQRLRKQCPNCGPGTFMATHFDRVYCGKCSTTYLVEEGAKAGKGKGKK